MEQIDKYIEKEKVLMDLEYEFVTEFIKLRKNLKLSQQKIADSSGVIRETIARIENSSVSPQLSTLIKVLEPLGYTVKIVPLSEEKGED